MTITEFLLARIAEDEAEARRWLDFYGYPEAINDVDASPKVLDFYEVRRLAECAAKRAIVAEWDEADAEHVSIEIRRRRGEKMPQWCTADSCMSDYSLCTDMRLGARVLLDLASVYADHPAFDPSWI